MLNANYRIVNRVGFEVKLHFKIRVFRNHLHGGMLIERKVHTMYEEKNYSRKLKIKILKTTIKKEIKKNNIF